MSELARTLSVVPTSWDRARNLSLGGAAATAIGGWAFMAWNRLGSQGLLAPRAGVRFLLVGFYTWVGLALVLWLAGRLVVRAGGDRDDADPWELQRLVQLSGLSHRPVLVVAVTLQFVSLVAPGSGIGLVVAVIGFGAWMPAMLVSALVWLRPQPVPRAIVIVTVPYLAWLATAGRYLFDQVGHLL